MILCTTGMLLQRLVNSFESKVLVGCLLCIMVRIYEDGGSQDCTGASCVGLVPCCDQDDYI